MSFSFDRHLEEPAKFKFVRTGQFLARYKTPLREVRLVKFGQDLDVCIRGWGEKNWVVAASTSINPTQWYGKYGSRIAQSRFEWECENAKRLTSYCIPTFGAEMYRRRQE
jgi:hypothetical protein